MPVIYYWFRHHTGSMRLMSPSWEYDRCAATQRISQHLCNQNVHYRVHKSPPSTGPYPEPDQSTPEHPILFKIDLSKIHLRLGLPSGLFPSGFPTNILYPFVFSRIRATWPTQLVLLRLFILITPTVCLQLFSPTTQFVHKHYKVEIQYSIPVSHIQQSKTQWILYMLRYGILAFQRTLSPRNYIYVFYTGCGKLNPLFHMALSVQKRGLACRTPIRTNWVYFPQQRGLIDIVMVTQKGLNW
jgi:hypothetical protein